MLALLSTCGRSETNSMQTPVPQRRKLETEQPMVKLQDEGFGKFVKSGNTAAFLKQLPSEIR